MDMWDVLKHFVLYYIVLPFVAVGALAFLVGAAQYYLSPLWAWFARREDL